MFKGLITFLLTKYLSQYIENLDATKLKSNLFLGDLQLEDLKLKTSALEGFDLPVYVTHGHLGRLVIKIPWTSLKSSPVIAEVTDLFIVVQPKKCVPYNRKKQEKFDLEQKQKSLDAYEAQRAKKEAEKETTESDDKKKDTFTSRLTDTIVNNLQINIQNVHIRYEDTSNPERPLVLGASLEKLSLESCDQQWKPTFVKDVSSKKFVYKIVDLHQFSVYCNPIDTVTLSDGSYSEKKILKTMKKMIQGEKNKLYILRPINGKCKATLQTESHTSFDHPKFKTDIEFDDVSFVLQDLQYQQILSTVEYIANYKKFEKFKSMKPKDRPDDEAAAKKWWAYAYDAARYEMDQETVSWEEIQLRLKYQKKYIKLYKRSLKLPWLKELSESEEEKKEKIESFLDLGSLLYYRELAQKELDLEKKQHKEFVAKKKENRGWLGWAFGSDPEKYSDEAADAINVSDEQKEWLREQISYSADDVSKSYKAPPEYVYLQMNISFKKGGIKLVDYFNQVTIAELFYNNITVTIGKREGMSIDVGVTLDSFEIFDRITPNTQYPQITVRRDVVDEKDSEGQVALVKNSEPFAHFDVNVSPLDSEADLQVCGKLARLDIILNMSLLQRLLGFFRKPSEVSLAAVQNVATKSISTVRQQAQAQLVLALEAKKVIDVRLDIDAPNIIIPEDCSDPQANVILLDMGLLSIKSDVDAQGRRERLKNHQAEEKDYYDKFDLSLNDFKILSTTTPVIKSLKSLDSFKADEILENVTLKLDLSHGITPLNLERPKTIVAGKIPKIKMHISPEHLEVLMKLLNKVRAIADDPTGQLTRHQRQLYTTVYVKGNVLSRHAKADRWNKYWCEIREKNIFFFENRESPKPLASIKTHKIFLNDLGIWKEDGDDFKGVAPEYCHHFSIHIPQKNPTADKVVNICVETDVLKITWMNHIRSLITKSNRIVARTGSVDQSEEESQSEKEKREKEQKKRDLAKAIKLLATFQLDNFSLELEVMDPETKKYKVISEVLFSNLALDFRNRNFDNTINFKLKEFSVTDLVDAHPKYVIKPMMSKSEYIADIKFINAKEFSPIYSDIANNRIELIFKKFNMYFDPLTLAQFLGFGRQMGMVVEKLESRMRVLEAITEDIVEEKLDVHVTKRSQLHLKANFDLMQLELIDFGQQFASLAMSKSFLTFEMGAQKTIANVSVSNLQLRDNSKDTIYREIVGLAGKDTTSVDFSFQILKNQQPSKVGQPFFNKIVKVKADGIKFVFLRRFITKLQIYFTTGPLMNALKEGSKKAASAAATMVKQQSENINMIKFDIEANDQKIIVPTSSQSPSKVLGQIQKICVTNQLQDLTELFNIQINDMELITVSNFTNVKSVMKKSNMLVKFSRVIKKDTKLTENSKKPPDMILDFNINPLTMFLAHDQYQMIFDLLTNNIQDTAGITDVRSLRKNAQKALKEKEKNKKDDSVSSCIQVKFSHMDLSLLRKDGRKSSDNLARLDLDRLLIDVKQRRNGKSTINVALGAIAAYDHREESTSKFPQFVSSNSGSSFMVSGKAQTTQESDILTVEYSSGEVSSVKIQVGDPVIMLVPEVVMEIKDFFINRLPPHMIEEEKEKAKENEKENDILVGNQPGAYVVTDDVNLYADLTISKSKVLRILKQNETDLSISSPQSPGSFSSPIAELQNRSEPITINGNGHTLLFDAPDVERALLEIEGSTKVRFKNIILKFKVPNNLAPKLIRDGKIKQMLLRPTEGVRLNFEEEEEEDDEHEDEEKNEKKAKPTGTRLVVNGELKKPYILIPQDPSREDTKQMVISTQLNLIYCLNSSKEMKELGSFEMKDFRVYLQSTVDKEIGQNILDPFGMRVEMIVTQEEPNKRNVQINLLDDIRTRISYNDVELIQKIVKQYTEKKEQEENKDIPEITIEGEDVGELSDDHPLSDDQALTDTFDDSRSMISDMGSVISSDDDDFVDPDEVDVVVQTPPVPEVQQQEEDINEEDLPDHSVKKVVQEEEEDDPSKAQIIDVNFETDYGLSVLLVDDIRGYDVPLVSVFLTKPTLYAFVRKTKNLALNAKLNFEVQAQYFNMKLAVWEPIIEPWKGAVEVNKSPNPKDVKMQVSLNSTQEQDTKMLNINVTQEMLSTLIKTGKVWKEHLTTDKTISKKYDPYTLRNHSGYDINLSIVSNQKERTIVVKKGEEKGFNLLDYRGHAMTHDQEVYVSVPNFDRIQVIINKEAVKSYTNSEKKLAMFIDTLIVEGRKTITVRSGIRIKNDSTIPWELGVSLKPDHVEPFGYLEPQETCGVPINIVERGIFVIRPGGLEKKYQWSKAKPAFSFIGIMTRYYPERMIRCGSTNPMESVRAYFAVTRVTLGKKNSKLKKEIKKETMWKLQLQDYLIELRPPLMIQNLLGREIWYKVSDMKILNNSKSMQLISGYLKRGERKFVYQANLMNNLLLHMKLDEDGWNHQKIPAVIYSNSQPEPRALDSYYQTMDSSSLRLTFHLDYDKQASEAYHEVRLYVPYWIVNHTSHPFTMYACSTKGNQAKKVAGQTTTTQDVDNEHALPLMFAFEKGVENKRVLLSLNKKYQSKLVGLDNPGMDKKIVVKAKKKKFDIGFHVSVAPGAFNRTKIVTFTARFQLINRTKYNLGVSQVNTGESITLAPEAKENWYWPRKTNKKEMIIRMEDSEYTWCSPFRLSSLGSFNLKLVHSKSPISNPPLLMNVNIKHDKATIFVAFEELKQPPFIIENLLLEDIQIAQSGLPNTKWWPAKKNKKTWFCWDDNTKEQRMEVKAHGQVIVSNFNCNKVTKSPKQIVMPHTDEVLYLAVLAKGPTRIIRISQNYDNVEGAIEAEPATLKIDTNLSGIGLSCINKNSQEIIYLSIKDIFARYERNSFSEIGELCLKSLQIDNQSQEDAKIPVILSHPVLKDKPFLQISSARTLKESSLFLFNYASVILQEANLSIDFQIAQLILDFVSELSSASSIEEDEEYTEQALEKTSAPPSDPCDAKPFYFDELFLPSIHVNLTFNLTKLGDNEQMKKNPLFLFLNTVGLTLVNCTDAPLRMNSLTLKYLYVSNKQILLDTIQKHYKRQALREMYKVVGSLDIVGNPIGLVNDVGTGVRDFFVEPFKVKSYNPEDMVKGLEKGTTSLVTHTFQGVGSTTSKFTNSLNKGLTSLTFDEEYIKNREQRKGKPVGFIEGVSEGGEALRKGFVDGATGIFLKPIEGAQEHGARGFFRGVAKGLVSVPVKPVAGILDFATKTGEGISNWNREIHNRVRFIRTFGDEGQLIPYNSFASLSQHFMAVCSTDEIKHEPLYFVQDAASKYITFLTNHSIIEVDPVKVVVKWQVSRSNLSKVNLNETTREIRLEHRERIKSSIILHRTQKKVKTIRVQQDNLSQLREFYKLLMRKAKK